MNMSTGFFCLFQLTGLYISQVLFQPIWFIYACYFVSHNHFLVFLFSLLLFSPIWTALTSQPLLYGSSSTSTLPPTIPLLLGPLPLPPQSLIQNPLACTSLTASQAHSGGTANQNWLLLRPLLSWPPIFPWGSFHKFLLAVAISPPVQPSVICSLSWSCGSAMVGSVPILVCDISRRTDFAFATTLNPCIFPLRLHVGPGSLHHECFGGLFYFHFLLQFLICSCFI